MPLKDSYMIVQIFGNGYGDDTHGHNAGKGVLAQIQAGFSDVTLSDLTELDMDDATFRVIRAGCKIALVGSIGDRFITVQNPMPRAVEVIEFFLRNRKQAIPVVLV